MGNQKAFTACFSLLGLYIILVRPLVSVSFHFSLRTSGDSAASRIRNQNHRSPEDDVSINSKDDMKGDGGPGASAN